MYQLKVVGVILMTSVLEENVMASSAEPTAAGQSAAGKVKTGKLGKHTNTTLYIVALLSS